MSEHESMPCPRCRTKHAKGDYIPRPELATKPLGNLLQVKSGGPYPPGHKYHGVRAGTPFCPPDVQCSCGALLRVTVPIFAVDLYGWYWRIV